MDKQSRTAPDHEIIVVPPVGQAGREGLWQQCYDLRIDVFHHEQKFPTEIELDDLEETSTHFLLRLMPARMPIGTIRATKLGSKNYKLSRLVVLKDYRQYNFGRELVSALHHWVKQDATGFVQIACHSQIYAKGFYEKCGYRATGDEFEEDGAPHQKMVMLLEGEHDEDLEIQHIGVTTQVRAYKR